MIAAPQPAMEAQVDQEIAKAWAGDQDEDEEEDDSDDEEAAAIKEQMAALHRKLEAKKNKKKQRLSSAVAPDIVGAGSSSGSAGSQRPVRLADARQFGAAAATSSGDQPTHEQKRRRLTHGAPGSVNRSGSGSSGSGSGSGSSSGGGFKSALKSAEAAAASKKVAPRLSGAPPAASNQRAGGGNAVAAGAHRLNTNSYTGGSDKAPVAAARAPPPAAAAATVAPLPMRKSAKGGGGTKTPTPTAVVDDTDLIESYSGIPIKNRLIGGPEFAGRMDGRTFIKMAALCKMVSGGKSEVHAEGDWVTVGVLTKKSASKKTKGDKNFAVWTLSDLGRLGGSEISCFMFEKAFDTHWKESEGMMFALLNPKIMPSQNGKTMSALNIDNPQLMMKMGKCPHFGRCKSITKAGAPCSKAINLQEGEHCEFHVGAAYKKVKGARMALNTGNNSVTARPSLPPKGKGRLTGLLHHSGAIVRVPGTGPGPQSRGELKKHAPHAAASAADIRGKISEETLNRTATHGLFKKTMGHMSATEDEAEQKAAETAASEGGTMSKRMQKLVGGQSSAGTQVFRAKSFDRGSGQYGGQYLEHEVTAAGAQLLNCTTAKSNKLAQTYRPPSMVTATRGGRGGGGVPQLGKGFALSGGGTISLTHNSTSNDKAEAIAKAVGGIAKRDPNAPETSMKRFKDSDAAAAAVSVGTATRKVDLTRNKPLPGALQAMNGVHQVNRRRALAGGMAGAPGTTRPMLKPAVKGSMADALGIRVDFDSAEGKRLVDTKSRNLAAAEEEQFAEIERKLDRISDIEKMEAKMESITEKQVNCFKCRTCKQLYRKKEHLCLTKGHDIQNVNAMLRYFKCKHCQGQKTTLGEKFPTIGCDKCGAGPECYVKGSMLRKKEYDNAPKMLLDIESQRV
jgi:minichromosome maintenance protein 10